LQWAPTLITPVELSLNSGVFVLRSFRVSRRTRRTSLNLLAAAGLALSAAACADSSTGNAANGKITVLLKDAPGDVKSAVVTISQIYLQGSSEGDDAGSRVILRNTPVTTDLLTLASSTAELVKDGTVPAGTYGQLRFVITGGYVEVENGDGTTSIFASSPDYAGLPSGASVAGSLQMPSYATSGLKVNLPCGAVTLDADQTVVLVDFDVSRSFGKEAGGSSKWVMSPVLTATELAFTGSVKVTLTKDPALPMPSINGTPLTLGQFKATLTKAGESPTELPLTDADNDGTFEASFQYVPAGDYSVDFVAPAGITSFATTPAHPATVSVTSAGSATYAAVLNAVTP
jgi:hypothetical protein